MNPRTVYGVLAETAALYGPQAALHQPLPGKGETKYLTFTWNDWERAAREIALGLRSLGIGKGDIVALDSETRLEFYVADLGIMANGSISAALYVSYPIAERARNLAGCNPKAVFVEDPKIYEQLRARAGIEAQWILLTGSAPGAMTLDDLRQRGWEALKTDARAFEKILSEYTAADFAILYLTSGATGEPKMGLTTHQSIVSNVDMGPMVLPLGPNDSTIAFLPSAHIAQRFCAELLMIRLGVPVWFSGGLSKLPQELKTIRPTFFLAPPRVWERMYSSICTEIRKRNLATRQLFYGSLGLGLKASRLRHEGKAIPGWLASSLKLADRAVFSKIRERLGGRLRMAASGAAPLGRDLAHFYEAIGMPLIEGYGLTEGGVTALNPLDRPKPGSIGKALPGVELKLGPDNELLIKSPTLFSRYYQDDASTAMVLKDGWLATGDIAEVDSEGYIYITGRKKELIVSSNGKKIYPSRIEALFKMEPLVNQIVLVGDRMPYVTALFTLNPAAMEALPGMDAHKGKVQSDLVRTDPVLEAVRKAVGLANKQLAPFEQIRKYRLLERDFSIEDGELTPTMKVRRKQVLENFRETVNELYAGKEESV
jgi:long-chain acyl-CoA synthetase